MYRVKRFYQAGGLVLETENNFYSVHGYFKKKYLASSSRLQKVLLLTMTEKMSIKILNLKISMLWYVIMMLSEQFITTFQKFYQVVCDK